MERPLLLRHRGDEDKTLQPDDVPAKMNVNKTLVIVCKQFRNQDL